MTKLFKVSAGFGEDIRDGERKYILMKGVFTGLFDTVVIQSGGEELEADIRSITIKKFKDISGDEFEESAYEDSDRPSSSSDWSEAFSLIEVENVGIRGEGKFFHSLKSKRHSSRAKILDEGLRVYGAIDMEGRFIVTELGVYAPGRRVLWKGNANLQAVHNDWAGMSIRSRITSAGEGFVVDVLYRGKMVQTVELKHNSGMINAYIKDSKGDILNQWMDVLNSSKSKVAIAN